jgi:DNA-binding PucR family transcriptional regulator
MRRSEKEKKSAIEGWIDERIQFALGGVTQSFERKVTRLRERIQTLQTRIREVSRRLEGNQKPNRRTGMPPGEKQP